MADIPSLVRDLVVANRILARESVVDAYGHVSVRHPDNPHRFFMATSMAPELVEPEHIVELNLDCTPVRDDGRPLYHERFIHGGIFEARPDVQAVVHAHSEDVLPFTIAPVALRPVIHSGSFIGPSVPVWDIADKFGLLRARRAEQHRFPVALHNTGEGGEIDGRVAGVEFLRAKAFDEAAQPEALEVHFIRPQLRTSFFRDAHRRPPFGPGFSNSGEPAPEFGELQAQPRPEFQTAEPPPVEAGPVAPGVGFEEAI